MKEQFEISSYNGFASHTYSASGTYKVKNNSIAPLHMMKNPREIMLPYEDKIQPVELVTGRHMLKSGCCVTGQSVIGMDSTLWTSDTWMFPSKIAWTNQNEVNCHTFEKCASTVEDVYLADGITDIPKGFCEGCWQLSAVVLPNTVSAIGPSAFYDCRSLKVLTVPCTVSSIGDDAFSGMPSDCSVYVTCDRLNDERVDNTDMIIRRLFNINGTHPVLARLMSTSSTNEIEHDPSDPKHHMSIDIIHTHNFSLVGTPHVDWGGGFELSYEAEWAFGGNAVAALDVLYETITGCRGPISLFTSALVGGLAVTIGGLVDGLAFSLHDLAGLFIKDSMKSSWSIQSDGSVSGPHPNIFQADMWKQWANDKAKGLHDKLGETADKNKAVLNAVKDLTEESIDMDRIDAMIKQAGLIGDKILEEAANALKTDMINAIITPCINIGTVINDMYKYDPTSVRLDDIKGNIVGLADMKLTLTQCKHYECDYPGCGFVEHGEDVGESLTRKFATNKHEDSQTVGGWKAILTKYLPLIDGRIDVEDISQIEGARAECNEFISNTINEGKTKILNELNQQLDDWTNKLELTDTLSACEYHEIEENIGRFE